MHCFPQCIHPIHSAHQKEPRPNTRDARRRTSSVRRQFAARRSCSPEQPPLAASLPAKEVSAQSRTDHAFPDGVFGRKATSKPLSPFVPAQPGHHSGADGSRLPCRVRRLANALRTPYPGLRPKHRSAPAEFYSGHSPPLRRLTGHCFHKHRPLLVPGRPDQAPDCYSGSRSGSCVSVGLQF